MRKKLVAALLILGAGASPARGQEVFTETTRGTFTFLSSQLLIDVIADVPGTLRIMRGDPGEIQVAGRSKEGFAGFAMSSLVRERLNLTAVGAERVDYLVIVPENIRVDIHLPSEQFPHSLGTLQRVATFNWSPPAGTVMTAAPKAETVPSGAVMVAYSAGTAPHMLRVTGIRTVNVHIEPGRFSVASTKALEANPAGSGILEVSSTVPSEIVVTVPSNATDFVLTIGGRPALMLDGTNVTALCTPAIDQQPASGKRWISFENCR